MNNETIESIKRYNIRATEEIKRLKEENKQLKQRNKEIYDGFKAATDELCEYATKIDKAIEYIKNNREIRTFYTPEQRWEVKEDFIKGYYELLEILGDEENEIS